jgi:hypothetical protein
MTEIRQKAGTVYEFMHRFEWIFYAVVSIYNPLGATRGHVSDGFAAAATLRRSLVTAFEPGRSR